MKPRLGILGLGLMGGSLAMAAREAGFCSEIQALDRDAEQLNWALEHRVIDQAAVSLAALLELDILVLATPMGAVPAILQEIAELGLPEHLCVTDLGSVKGCVVQAAKQVFGQMPVNIIPGHPIAGSEKSGVQAGRADLFRQRKVVLTPEPNAAQEQIALLNQLWLAVGARPCILSADEHDRVYASTSHLPHVLAFTFINTLLDGVGSTHLRESVAGGFRDFSRIAASDPRVWRDICLANASEILASIDRFSDELSGVRQCLSEGQADPLLQYFERARQARLDSEQHWCPKIVADFPSKSQG